MASSLMPPPPPMPPKSSAKRTPSSSTENSELASSDGVAPQAVKSAPVRNSESAVTDDKEKEKEDVSLQVTGEKEKKKIEEILEKDKRIDGARVQTRFNSGIYSIPSWSAAPAFPFMLEVIKDGAFVETLNVSSKGAYMFGRSDQCDFIMEHPSISRFHAVLQFKRTGDVYIYDLGSTHGTIVNKKQVSGKTYVPLCVGDLFKFGLSSRLYVLQGPSELMPKEGPTKAEKVLLREAQIFYDSADQEASLLRAKRQAVEIEGISWGMLEDAPEAEIQEEEEVTWQTYKGQLTEKQQKTLEKIHKRNDKVSSLKREIDAIQVKEIPQGGLTQGQQTQVARNQQRIEQLMEELDNLEETLNQSIQESMGARGLQGTSKKKFDDEEEDLSDDDDFYDRTNHSRKTKANVKGSEHAEVVETAESLLEKRAEVLKEIERLNNLLKVERKDDDETSQLKSQDPLDAFMTTVSSKLGSEQTFILRQEIARQEADLNRIMYLLKIADPGGEALKNWGNKRSTNPTVGAGTKQVGQKLPQKDPKNKIKQDKSGESGVVEKSRIQEAGGVASQVDEQEDKGKLEKLKGPLLLGHIKTNVVETRMTAENLQETSTNDEEFLEYKERHKSISRSQESSDIPEDASGLILRKPKESGRDDTTRAEDAENEKRLWENAALAAADTVALLLRHQKGLGAAVDEELQDETSHTTGEDVASRSKKRKLGPEKPDFLNKEEGKFQAWVPPTGQTGDGKTSLNEKYGY